MAIAYDPDNFFDYVLERERKLPPDEQTIWHLKTLSAREMAAVENSWQHKVSADEETPKGKNVSMNMNRGTMIVELLRRGLCGWDNLLDRKGKPVAFIPGEKGGFCNAKNIDRVDPTDRHELAGAIEAGGKLDETDVKN
ncbi:MAG: hypothetical protein V1929_03420 [bacterium]